MGKHHFQIIVGGVPQEGSIESISIGARNHTGSGGLEGLWLLMEDIISVGGLI